MPRFLACSLLRSISVQKVWLFFGEFLGGCNQGRAYESKQEVANIEKVPLRSLYVLRSIRKEVERLWNELFDSIPFARRFAEKWKGASLNAYR
jgi:hypothetical protein